jgi:uncharacterized protein YeaO (DUF488 family)
VLTKTAKSIYDERYEADDTRILIARIYPCFIKNQYFDERMLVSSPDRDTLPIWNNSQKTEEDKKRFEEKFLPQIKIGK